MLALMGNIPVQWVDYPLKTGRLCLIHNCLTIGYNTPLNKKCLMDILSRTSVSECVARTITYVCLMH